MAWPVKHTNFSTALAAVARGFSGATESSRFNRLMLLTVGPLLLADIALASLLHLGASKEFAAVAGLFVTSPSMWILIAACWYCRWRGGGLMRLGDVAQLSAWSLLVIPAISFLIPAAARTPFPLVDASLERLDALMHFHTVAVVRTIGSHPPLQRVLTLSYAMLPLLIVGALVIPALCGKPNDSRRYVIAVLIAAIITGVLFAFFPAAGPWTVEGFAPDARQAVVVESLTLLKSGQPMPATDKDSGVVAFPSFHVVLALLSAIAMWRISWVRAFALALAILISMSTITTGWHYGVDVIGGLAVTYAAQTVANRYLMPASEPLFATLASKDACDSIS